MLSGVAVTSLTFVYFLPAYMEASVRKLARHFPVVALVLVMTKITTVCPFVNFVSNNDDFFVLYVFKDPSYPVECCTGPRGFFRNRDPDTRTRLLCLEYPASFPESGQVQNCNNQPRIKIQCSM